MSGLNLRDRGSYHLEPERTVLPYILTPFFSRVYKVVHKVESVSRLTHLLLDTPHGGYPVVTKTDAAYEVFSGLISR